MYIDDVIINLRGVGRSKVARVWQGGELDGMRPIYKDEIVQRFEWWTSDKSESSVGHDK